jgi:glycosyltransferase involved in cell wall biosynthesis
MQGKSNNPLVSICLPTYNYAHYLPAAISSCLRQTYEEIELIIVDDASTDDSRRVIESFSDPRLRFSENPVRLGLAGNWNRSLSLVRGDIVKFIFADDYLREDAIEEIVKAYENPSIDLAFSSARVIDGGGKYLYTHEPYSQTTLLPGPAEALRCLIKGNYIGGPSSVAVRTRTFKRVGTFDETLRFHVDQEMWIRILLQGDAYFLSPPLVSVRQHEGSETSRLDRAGETDEDNLRFLTGCLRNDKIRLLLTPDELKQLIERRDDLARLQSERATSRSQSGPQTVNLAAVLKSKIRLSIKAVLDPVYKKIARNRRIH